MTAEHAYLAGAAVLAAGLLALIGEAARRVVKGRRRLRPRYEPTEEIDEP